MEKSRDRGLDLLRFVSMMMVVTLHYNNWGGALDAVRPYSFNFLFVYGTEVFCYVAVNCYYMISGYYLKPSFDINKKRESRRIWNLWWKTFFYSVTCYLLLCVIGFAPYSAKVLVKAFFPVMSNRYWFMSVFIVLSLFRPFIEKLLGSISDKELFVLLSVFFFFDCIQTITDKYIITGNGYGVFHALFMLLLGYSFRRFRFLSGMETYKAFFLYIAAALASGGLAAYNMSNARKVDLNIIAYNAPLIVTASVGIFALFKNIKKCPAIFSKIAPYILAVYLINDHPEMRTVFWEKVLHCSHFYKSPFLILHLSGCVLGFIVAGVIIDFVVTKVLTLIGIFAKRRRNSQIG